jgi:hypothetical protein
MTTLKEDGFLADETGAVMEMVREKYAPWLLEMRALNRLLMRLQFELNGHAKNAQHLACAALFARSLSHAQAAILLLERGMSPSGRAMLRCALEGTFRLVACSREYQTAVVFFDEIHVDLKRKARQLGELAERDRAGMDEALRTRMLAEATAKIAEFGAYGLSASEMATRSGLDNLYLTAYAFLCGAVHSSANDLSEHYVVDGDRNVTSIRTGPDFEKLAGLFLMLGETMGLMADAIYPVFRLANDGQVERHVAALQALTVDRSV